VNFANIPRDMDFGVMRPGLQETGTACFSIRSLGLMYPNFVSFGDIDVGKITGGPEGCGLFDSGPGDGRERGSDVTDHDTMLNQSAYDAMILSDTPENNTVTVDVTHHDLTGLSNLIPLIRERGTMGIPQKHLANQASHLLSGDSRTNSCDVSLPHQHGLGTNPNLKRPARVYLGDSTARKKAKSNNWREYQPKPRNTALRVTAEEWQEYRPFLEQLYVVENIKLKDVMKILETKFGFVATYVIQSGPGFHHPANSCREKMYKTKITQWGLMKNYKACEKEHLVRIAKAHHDSGQAIPRLILRNRPAKMDRIRRFCKTQNISQEICDALPLDSSNSQTSSLSVISSGDCRAPAGVTTTALCGVRSSFSSLGSYCRKGLFDPERPFSVKSRNDRVELILLQIKVYYETYFPSIPASCKPGRAARLELRNVPENAELSNYLNEWRSKLLLGVLILGQEKPAQGWRLINEACGMFHRILGQKPLGLFRLLFFAFNDDDWAMHSDLSAHILRFFTKIAAARLGCNHPICIVLYHLQGQELFGDAVRPVFEVLMDLFEEDSHSTVREVWDLKVCHCCIMRKYGGYFAAKSTCLRALKRSEDVYGRLHWRTRSFLNMLGTIHHAQGLHDLAEAKFQDALQRGREDPRGDFPDEDSVSTLQILAVIYESRGFVQSEEYWREALDGAIKVWGIEDECTIYLVNELERSFKRQGKDPEAWLQQNFDISCI
jgi:hypothetical protein